PMHEPDTQHQRIAQIVEERGWISVDDLLQLASRSPVDPEEAARLARDAGIELVETDADAWEEVEALAEEGPEAFTSLREVRAPIEELAPSDPATLYLREISRTRLLTADEEVELAKQIEAGREARDRLTSESIADPEQRERLEERVHVGEAARRRMIEANL